MDLSQLLARLEPLEQRVVALVYFDDRSPADAARILAVERIVITTALAIAFRRVARWVMDDDIHDELAAVPVAP